MGEKQVVGLSKKQISDFQTSELVDELSQREGVETSTLAPYVEAVVKVSGPAKVLAIID
ncbi:MAG: BC1881 family protein [Gordonibacter sp.]|uniref:BC1881 family protein n=1 Tax=Gordonibacter sp. TaxID=1968902 RepID=UPI002FC74AE0